MARRRGRRSCADVSESHACGGGRPTVGGVSERAMWTVTTHDWLKDVDVEHLAQIRYQADLYSAGGRRHMILEVLAYANDEAESIGRVGLAVVTTNDAGMVTVADDGRGTDTRLDRDGGVIRKPVMSTRDSRFFDAGLDSPQHAMLAMPTRHVNFWTGPRENSDRVIRHGSRPNSSSAAGRTAR